jgi:site-specific DNA-methyltransferase (adenine-specific)
VKPYYQDASVTIYHGDCRDLLPDLSADAVMTDPPYGTGHYASDTDALDADTFRSMALHGAAVFGWPEQLVARCVAASVVPDEWVTWWATNKAGRSAGLMRECECIAIFGSMPGLERALVNRTGGGPAVSGIIAGRGLDPERRRAGDVWQEAAPGMGFLSHLRQHPNEKPMGIVRRLVDLCTDPCGTVVDPFCGSGTTLRAAKDLGRKAIGIEIEERYCEIAAKRCAQEVLDLGEAA